MKKLFFSVSAVFCFGGAQASYLAEYDFNKLHSLKKERLYNLGSDLSAALNALDQCTEEDVKKTDFGVRLMSLRVAHDRIGQYFTLVSNTFPSAPKPDLDQVTVSIEIVPGRTGTSQSCEVTTKRIGGDTTP